MVLSDNDWSTQSSHTCTMYEYVLWWIEEIHSIDKRESFV
jgi:hypothetical protein